MPTTRNEINRVHVIMDFSKASWKAYEEAGKITRFFKHDLHVLCPKEDYSVKQLASMGFSFGASDELQKALTSRFPSYQPKVISTNNKWRNVISDAVANESNGPTEIFVGVQKSKNSDAHLSAHSAYKLSKSTSVPVFGWVEDASEIKEILLPFDNNKHSREKLYYGVLIAKAYNARVHLLMLNSYSSKDEILSLRNATKQLEDYVIKNGVSYWLEERSVTSAEKTVLDYIEEKKIDLMICSTEMEHNLADIFKGTTPARISEQVHISTFWIPERVSWGMIGVSI